jgi:hypothetical protein
MDTEVGGGGCTVTVQLANFVLSAVDVALTVAVPATEPAVTTPVLGFTDTAPEGFDDTTE